MSESTRPGQPAEPLITIEGLSTHFFLDEGTVRAVDGVDLTVPRGKTLCVVGESGCGKSITAFSCMRMIARPGEIVGGKITLHHPPGQKVVLTDLDEDGEQMRSIRGRDIAMVFQEPMTSLSPVHTVGSQIAEAVQLHTDNDKKGAKEQAIGIMRRVGIPNPEGRYVQYPHELSGGLRQRAMIAMALSCEPTLLIADEPTTALDVTIQAQILRLMRQLQAEFGMAIMLITHDLGVVAQMADEVAVMYLGRVVEYGPVNAIFAQPRHPYTQALLRSLPGTHTDERKSELEVIEGSVPDPFDPISGCAFHPRCREFEKGRCDVGGRPPLKAVAGDPTHQTACLLQHPGAEDGNG
ncbi:MAG: ABC transporter ATP-binding protein [Gemmatimonadetes bacterium]|jgi:oligopeptide/dipeptide ABC transporter ATP-binding protein|nr:ABC transporter ATP-binding protein [Gemmatimonadota bacterium]MBT6145747.1 ABC transporter ATP-binding protein [Gemmatimonadota bacterium]MBT7859322.1 ABC transporter ATP-binding protein [Gemmatimonadota bacterium]